jgi:hypothetical protein
MLVTLDDQTLSILAVVAIALAVLAVLVAVVNSVRSARLRRSLTVLDDAGDGRTFLEAVSRQGDQVAALRSEVAALTVDTRSLRTDLSAAIRHVAVVRYDAFGDMGGRFSFSVALLDDAGDGLVLTSISGRTESRSYARGVIGGRGDVELSPEEQQAVDHAYKGVSRG